MARLRKSVSRNRCAGLIRTVSNLELEGNIKYPWLGWHNYVDKCRKIVIKDYRRVAKQKRSFR